MVSMNFARIHPMIFRIVGLLGDFFKIVRFRSVLAWVLILATMLACRFSLQLSESSPSPSWTPTVPSVMREVSYVADAQALQTLDIYTPPTVGKEPHAVMIYVHGGAWTAGDKSRVHLKDDFFTHQGWVFISVNYRLYPQVAWQEMAQDVANAIAWVHGHISVYGGDAQRIFLMGHSAGAHLVSLVATDERYLQAAGLSLEVLRGVLALDTRAYDIPSLAQADGELPRVYAQIFGSDPQVWQAASPIKPFIA